MLTQFLMQGEGNVCNSEYKTSCTLLMHLFHNLVQGMHGDYGYFVLQISATGFWWRDTWKRAGVITIIYGVWWKSGDGVHVSLILLLNVVFFFACLDLLHVLSEPYKRIAEIYISALITVKCYKWILLFIISPSPLVFCIYMKLNWRSRFKCKEVLFELCIL